MALSDMYLLLQRALLIAIADGRRAWTLWPLVEMSAAMCCAHLALMFASWTRMVAGLAFAFADLQCVGACNFLDQGTKEMHAEVLHYTYDIHDHCLPRS